MLHRTIPERWKDIITPTDQKWIARSHFRNSATEKLELRTPLQLWYFPPQHPIVSNQPPIQAFISPPKLLSGGVRTYKWARKVIDLARYY